MGLFNNAQENLLPIALPKTNDYSMQWNKNLNGFNIKIPHGELFYSEHFFNKKISDRSVEYL